MRVWTTLRHRVLRGPGLRLTLVLLLDRAVDLVHTGLDVVPGQVLIPVLTTRRLQTHQLIHVPARERDREREREREREVEGERSGGRERGGVGERGVEGESGGGVGEREGWSGRERGGVGEREGWSGRERKRERGIRGERGRERSQ